MLSLIWLNFVALGVCPNGDITYLICHVTSGDHVWKGFCHVTPQSHMIEGSYIKHQGREPLMVSQHPNNFRGHRDCRSG